MTRNELSHKIADKSGITADAVNLILSLAIDEIRQSVNQGEPVTLRTFGTFSRVIQPAKIGRILSNNTPYPIPSRFTVRFKPSKTWKQEIHNIH